MGNLCFAGQTFDDPDDSIDNNNNNTNKSTTAGNNSPLSPTATLNSPTSPQSPLNPADITLEAKYLGLTADLELDLDGDLAINNRHTRSRSYAQSHSTHPAVNNNQNGPAAAEIQIQVLIEENDNDIIEEESPLDSVESEYTTTVLPMTETETAAITSKLERVPSRVHRLKAKPAARPSKLSSLKLNKNGTMHITARQAQQLVAQNILIFADYDPSALQTPVHANANNRSSNSTTDSNSIINNIPHHNPILSTTAENQLEEPDDDDDQEWEAKILPTHTRPRSTASTLLSTVINQQTVNNNNNETKSNNKITNNDKSIATNNSNNNNNKSSISVNNNNNNTNNNKSSISTNATTNLLNNNKSSISTNNTNLIPNNNNNKSSISINTNNKKSSISTNRALPAIPGPVPISIPVLPPNKTAAVQKYRIATLKLNHAGTLKMDQIMAIQNHSNMNQSGSVQSHTNHNNTNNRGSTNGGLSSAQKNKRVSININPCIIHSMRMEFPANSTHGVIFHLSGTKPADLIVTQAWLDLNGDSFWSALIDDQVWAIKMAIKIFRRNLPLKLCQKKMNSKDFIFGSSTFNTSISFGIDGKGMNKQLTCDRIRTALLALQHSKSHPNPNIIMNVRYTDTEQFDFIDDGTDDPDDIITTVINDPNNIINRQSISPSSISSNSSPNKPLFRGKALFSFETTPKTLLDSVNQKVRL